MAYRQRERKRAAIINADHITSIRSLERGD
jgi:hypothetical protein